VLIDRRGGASRRPWRRSSSGGAGSADAAGRKGLGTFGGVFTPSVLTILGVIMYLRFGWVLGNAGLRNTLIIVTIATSITLLTGLSIAQISTDQEIRAGGAYYMVSRSLGSEIGGAIGIPLFVAQALSVALYTLGFAESVNAFAPHIPIKPLALVTTAFVAVIAIVSARTAIRVQYVIMAGIVLSLVSLFLGTNTVEAPPPELGTMPEVAFTPEPFWVVFAVFFPAVTGIMAGVNMSGDLARPRRSIPRGTLAAILVSYVIYMVIPVVLDRRADATALVDDPLIMRQLALWGPAILIGVWGATLSSALGSILGAPRILQALARDEVLPRPLRFVGRGNGPNDEPRIGTYVSLAIALVVVAVGDLNAVAPVLTMFFLSAYAMVNFVSAGERFLRTPSFRPTFRVHWSVSFAGAIGCAAVMFLISEVATIVAFAVIGAIWTLLNRRRARARWGDIRQGLWINLIRWGAGHIRPSTHAKGWRPNILVLAGSPTKRFHLIDLAHDLSHGRGLLTIATILPEPTPSPRKRQLAETVREHLAERNVKALVRVVSAPTPYLGASVLVEAYGLGGLVPNTVVLGVTSGEPAEYTVMIRRIHEAGRNIVVLRSAGVETFGDRRRIDVWLRSMRDNGALMLTLANTLKSSAAWKRATITLRMVVASDEARAGVEANLRDVLTKARLDVDVDVIADPRPVGEVIAGLSSWADLTMVGLPDPCVHEDDFGDRFDALLARVSTERSVAFVLASNDVDLSALLD
jgi:amino acid transporter